ncbi:MAG TPA: type II toxin-antitoxin system PemK/MazF family toxin [Thermodesulfobacteriota bacterium]|nr:type II toxin-antitoxin system PemK/MazF family toxin [Thermodesulfobacteriota bacterium]
MKQREIWLINLDPTIGAELKKTRPCVILSNNAIGVLPLKVIVPITDYKPRYDKVSWMVKVSPNSMNNLDKASVIDLFQVRSVAKERLVKKIGEISDEELEQCRKALETVFG